MAAERERDADAFKRDPQRHLRCAGDALGEHQRDLLDPGAREMGELGRLDLERVARAQQLDPRAREALDEEREGVALVAGLPQLVGIRSGVSVRFAWKSGVGVPRRPK
jgi:RecB family exonuclease